MRSVFPFVVVVCAGAGAGLAQHEPRVLLLTGADAPGLPGVTFDDFSRVSFDAVDSVVFRANLTGAGVSGANEESFWRLHEGALTLIARAGNPAPFNAPGFTFTGMDNIVAQGDSAVFSATASNDGGATERSGIWRWTDGVGIELLVGVGDVLPGLGGAPIEGVNRSAFAANASGDVAFVGALDAGFATTGLWQIVDGVTSVVAIEDEPTPDGGPNPFSSNLIRARIDDNAAVAIGGLLVSSDAAAYSTRDGSLQKVARSGDALNNRPGETLGLIETINQRSDGLLAFSGSLDIFGFDSAIFAESAPGVLDVVIAEGDPASGVPGGVIDGFGAFFTPFAVSDSGHVAYHASFDGFEVIGGFNDEGIWYGPIGAQTLVARRGAPAPDVGDQVAGFIPLWFGFEQDLPPVITRSGEAFFYADLVASDETNDAIFHVAPGQEPTLMLRGGDTFDVLGDGSDIRTFDSPNDAPDYFALPIFPTGENDASGLPSSVNDDADVILALPFTDGSEGLVLFERLADAPNCNPADLSEPFGVLDFSDVLTFVIAFGDMDPAADLGAPAGVFDFIDVLVFLGAFSDGCP